jgi:hypothetical protein
MDAGARALVGVSARHPTVCAGRRGYVTLPPSGRQAFRRVGGSGCFTWKTPRAFWASR